MTELTVELLEQARVYLEGTASEAEPEPEFGFTIGWFDDYDHLFRLEPRERSDVSQLSSRARSQRTLLCARGGGAKTVVLHRLARSLVNRGCPVVLVDLKAWLPGDGKLWSALESYSARMNFLLSRFSSSDVTSFTFDILEAQTERYLFVDGLNEVAFNIGHEILDALDDFSRYGVSLGLIVTDRLTRRPFSQPDRWNLATVMPLSDDEIQRVLSDAGSAEQFANLDRAGRELASIPYFLKRFAQGFASDTRSNTIARFLEEHASLTREQVDRVAAAAYNMYTRSKSRTFQFAAFREDAGAGVTRSLLEAGIIFCEGHEAYFAHHLHHDFLAARHLALHTELWTVDALNAVTLGASSFDALSLTLEQLHGEAADAFFALLYDWNIYGAAYAVTESLEGRESVLSLEMECVILTMLAIRRFDVLQSTRTKSIDALSLFPKAKAEPYLLADSKDQLYELAANIDSTKPTFLRWRALLTRPTNQDFSACDLEDLATEQSIIGWTLANVVRQRPLSRNMQRRLVKLLAQSTNQTVRWRVVHVLGKGDRRFVIRALFKRVLDDDSAWVKYGAARSLVEIAILNRGFRKSILARFEKMAQSLLEDPQTLNEVRESLFPATDVAPNGWVKAVAPLVEEFFLRETNEERRTEWQRTAMRLQSTYDYQRLG